MGLFEDWVKKLRPSWMSAKAQAIWGGFASVLNDGTQAWAEQGNLEHLPLAAQDAASVALIASERQIEPGATEDITRALSVAWLDLARNKGTPTGILVGLYFADFPGAVIVTQNGLAWTLNDVPVLADLTIPTLPAWVTRTVLPDANPFIPVSNDGKPAIPALTIPWWDFGNPMDANTDQWNARFGILFPGGQPPSPLTDAANLARIRRIIAAWKPAKALGMGIWVAGTGPTYGGGFKYGTANKYTVGGTAYYAAP